MYKTVDCIQQILSYIKVFFVTAYIPILLLCRIFKLRSFFLAFYVFCLSFFLSFFLFSRVTFLFRFRSDHSTEMAHPGNTDNSAVKLSMHAVSFPRQ